VQAPNDININNVMIVFFIAYLIPPISLFDSLGTFDAPPALVIAIDSTSDEIQ
jgi:hypothetical protein